MSPEGCRNLTILNGDPEGDESVGPPGTRGCPTLVERLIWGNRMTMTEDASPTADKGHALRHGLLRRGMEPLVAMAARARKLDVALADLARYGDAAHQRAVRRLRGQLAAIEPSVTLLGQVKSGKTTLVNAMSGWTDLLPSDVNPWTSVVTSLHLRPDMAEGTSRAAFTFFGADEWDRLMAKGGKLGELADRAGAAGELLRIREQIEAMRDASRRRLGRRFELLLGQTHEYGYFDKNLVERYICLGDLYSPDVGGTGSADQGRFADITRSADLFLHAPALPVPLCLRDTPGVNDTFMMREQVTLQALRDSRVCVVVLSAHQALTAVDMGVIRMISALRARDVVIFVNRIDELSDPGAQVPEIRDSIAATLKARGGPEEAQIVFGSACWATQVLANRTDAMPDASRKALMSWAKARLGPGDHDEDAAATIWTLSGLPELYAALSARIAEGPGNEALSRIARAAMNLASGLRLAQSVTVSATGEGNLPDPAHIDRDLAALAAGHRATLEEALARNLDAFRTRAARAQDNFLDRATQSLIRHLEVNGRTSSWHYDPMGLRLLLRSAHTVFASQSRGAAQAAFDALADDIAGLYARTFGAAVDGLTIAAPRTSEPAAPITVGQTIALDFKDSWWTGWWQRTRGYRAFADGFRAMIGAETGAILSDLTEDQAQALHEGLLRQFDDFVSGQRSAIAGLARSAAQDAAGLRAACDQSVGKGAAQTLTETIEHLSDCAA